VSKVGNKIVQYTPELYIARYLLDTYDLDEGCVENRDVYAARSRLLKIGEIYNRSFTHGYVPLSFKRAVRFVA